MENVKVVIRSHQSKKDIQYKSQKRHTIQWPKKTYNTMANKDIQYNGKKRTRPRGHTNDLQNITQIIKD
jgi:hypothetical protein